jgi:hypothetical protein
MFLYKASGHTYKQVIRQQVHAFPYSPAETNEDEFILLSKNKQDCSLVEKQIQCTGKLHSIRLATPEELDAWFPNVAAGERWRYAMRLYWIRELTLPFNLSEVTGFNARRYAQVQGFAKIDAADELAMVRHLFKTNEDLILDVLNNAERPVASDDV